MGLGFWIFWITLMWATYHVLTKWGVPPRTLRDVEEAEKVANAKLREALAGSDDPFLVELGLPAVELRWPNEYGVRDIIMQPDDAIIEVKSKMHREQLLGMAAARQACEAREAAHLASFNRRQDMARKQLANLVSSADLARRGIKTSSFGPPWPH